MSDDAQWEEVIPGVTFGVNIALLDGETYKH